MLRYYWLVLCKAFRPSWAMADTVGSVLGLLVPFAAKFIPEGKREAVAELIWQVPLCVLLTLFLVRIVMSPWLIHKEQETKLTDAHKQLADKANELTARDRIIQEERAAHKAELDRAKSSDPKASAVREEIRVFIRRFEELIQRANTEAWIPGDAFCSLDNEAKNYLTENFRAYKRYCINDRPQWGTGVNRNNHSSQDVIRLCQLRIARLKEVEAHHS